MMSLMVGEDAFDYDVVDGDDGCRGALTWGTCNAPFFSAIFPLNLPKYIFSTLVQPLFGYCSDYLQETCSENSISATV